MADKPPVALESRGEGEDGRRCSPSVARNRDPIRDVLAHVFISPARVLEIASGTGEHGAFLTCGLPGLHWTYSDLDGDSLISQRAWQQADTTGRLAGPLRIDASTEDWSDAESQAPWDAIFCANMVHIAPWPAAEGLIRGAGRLLRPGGLLILYGPFARSGAMAPSNAAFDESLKSRNRDWGVRDLDVEISPLAQAAGLELTAVTEMPANNLTVVFRRRKALGSQPSVP
jgi:SAM-dependent methyltransferase